MFRKRLQIRRIGGHAVIVNILTVRHIGDLGVAAYAETATGALVYVLHVDLLARKVGLAVTVDEEFFRDGAVLLAHFYVESLSCAMYYAGLSQCFT